MAALRAFCAEIRSPSQSPRGRFGTLKLQLFRRDANQSDNTSQTDSISSTGYFLNRKSAVRPCPVPPMLLRSILSFHDVNSALRTPHGEFHFAESRSSLSKTKRDSPFSNDKRKNPLISRTFGFGISLAYSNVGNKYARRSQHSGRRNHHGALRKSVNGIFPRDGSV